MDYKTRKFIRRLLYIISVNDTFIRTNLKMFNNIRLFKLLILINIRREINMLMFCI